MSLGRLVNQVGVSLWENSDAISLETASELVRASATREDGSAVWRTERTETLWRMLVNELVVQPW